MKLMIFTLMFTIVWFDSGTLNMKEIMFYDILFISV